MNNNKVIKFYIETYGCQMNEYDSLIAQKILEEEKSQRVYSAKEADIILLNTCAVRENAETKIFNRIDALGHLKNKEKQKKRIGILGCMSQDLKEKIFEKSSYVDFILGPDNLRELKSIVQTIMTSTKKDLPQKINSTNKISYVTLSKTETYEDLLPNIEHHLDAQKNKITGFVSIQRGCDNFCSYCVVPFTRGRERSRSVKTIIEEIQMLVDSHFKSVVLLGQNVNSYNFDGYTFTQLIKTILDETSISRIYFMSPHPKDFPLELLDLMANNDRFANYIHLPLQSGSSRILELMRRDYSQKEFLNLVKLIRSKIPDVMLTTDIITGFSSETEKDHQETLSVLKAVQFDSAFMFMYSERNNTSAKRNNPDDVTEIIKKKRLQEIIDLQLKISLQKNQNYINKTVKVLVEGVSKKNPNELMSTTSNGKKVIFPMLNENDNFKNYFAKEYEIIIDNVTSNTLRGSIIKKKE